MNHELESDRRRRPGIGWRARFLAAALVVSSVSAVTAATAATVASGAATGIGPGDAAASCWEIKQLHPTSTDGIYWLRTERLVRPQQFYCDMTTDGGGWVLIGRGREGWTFKVDGQSTAQRLRDVVTGPDAFAPAALSGETIDGLLDGAPVTSLPDGLRLRRAAAKDGSSWQELRWRFADLGAWSWALGGGHRLAGYSIDGVAGTGSNTKDSSLKMWNEPGAGNRTGTNRNGWFTFPWSGHNRQAGFSYRGNVAGERNATSYLWEYNTEKQALPFTQLFIRPRITSTPLTPIGDAGLGSTSIGEGLDDRPLEIAGGVVGMLNVGDSEPRINAPVLAITTLGERVYVGGKFADVRDSTTGQLVRHSYLAAFDRRTGAWIPSFRPRLDGTVWDLDVAGGRLIVAGQFTNVDGVPGTSALAALDPLTGAVDPTWRASLAVTGTTQRPLGRTIDVDGGWIYVGGNFTSISGGGLTLAVGRLARVAVGDGRPDRVFRPDVDGVPNDIDVANDVVQVVGVFKGINGDARNGVGTLRTSDGSVVDGLARPVWTSTTKQYQQAVLTVGSDVWQGGSEHNVHVYDESTYALEKAYLTDNQGGDTQAFALAGDSVVQGSHGNAWIYEDTTFRNGLVGYKRADNYNWIGVFDADTHAYDRSFVPGLRAAYSNGAWALHTDADGCVWFGGDFLGGPHVNGRRQYLESFSKFCGRDSVAPTTPTAGLATIRSAGGVTVTWRPSTDDRVGYLGYEVLRNDRVVSPLVYGTSFVDLTGSAADRYFVRAVDPAGNRSATTPVFVAADNLKPTTPKDLVATAAPDGTTALTWTASTDDIRVERYRVLRNGVEIASVTGDQTATTVQLALGSVHFIQLQAVDNAGNLSNQTASVRVDLTVAPTTTTATTTTTTATTIAPTTSAPGATSTSTAPGPTTTATTSTTSTTTTTVATATTGVADTSNPSTPRDLVATARADGGIDVSWSASRDNVGVAAYSVTRNAVEQVLVPGTATTATLTGLGAGDHHIQVQALDAAGNRSHRTPSVLVTIVAPPGPDTSNPTTPRNLTAVAQPDGSVEVAWTASTDNVGVTSYQVTRNAVQVAVVTSTSARLTGLGPGTHHIQVRAFDAAGNMSHRTPSVAVTL